MGGSGASSVGRVGGLVVGLTAQRERVLVGAMGTRIGSLHARWTVRLCLALVHDVESFSKFGLKGDRQKGGYNV